MLKMDPIKEEGSEIVQSSEDQPKDKLLALCREVAELLGLKDSRFWLRIYRAEH